MSISPAVKYGAAETVNCLSSRSRFARLRARRAVWVWVNAAHVLVTDKNSSGMYSVVKISKHQFPGTRALLSSVSAPSKRYRADGATQ